MLKTYEETKRDWAEKGYTAIKGSEATATDWNDTTKVIIRWV